MSSVAAAGAERPRIVVPLELVADDYVELIVYQNSGGAVNTGAVVPGPADLNTLSAHFLG